MATGANGEPINDVPRVEFPRAKAVVYMLHHGMRQLQVAGLCVGSVCMCVSEQQGPAGATALPSDNGCNVDCSTHRERREGGRVWRKGGGGYQMLLPACAIAYQWHAKRFQTGGEQIKWGLSGPKKITDWTTSG